MVEKSTRKSVTRTSRKKKTLKDSRPEQDSNSASRWTFLTNHAHVLVLLHSESDLVLREVATRVGITERAVQRIIQDLERDGFIQRERVGRKNHYVILKGESLRHPIESHRRIEDLLTFFA